VLGDRWTAHVLAAAFYGLRRFNDLQAELKVASNILTDRLAKAGERGMLERVLYQERPEALGIPADDRGPGPVPAGRGADGLGRPMADWKRGKSGNSDAQLWAVLEPVVRCGDCGGGVDVGTQIDAPLPGALSRSD
jgi:hypothetical protein